MFSSFHTQKIWEIFCLLIYFGVWLGFFLHELAASQVCLCLRIEFICAHISLTPQTNGLQSAGCCIRGHLARAGSLNLWVSSGPVRTRACQMAQAVLGAAGNAQQTSPEICIPCVLSSPDSCEEVKGVKRAGEQIQPQTAPISQFQSALPCIPKFENFCPLP